MKNDKTPRKKGLKYVEEILKEIDLGCKSLESSKTFEESHYLMNKL